MNSYTEESQPSHGKPNLHHLPIRTLALVLAMLGQACEVADEADVPLSDDMEQALHRPPAGWPKRFIAPFPIMVPDNDYAMPAKQYLLPVIFKTADAIVPGNGQRINQLLHSYEESPEDTDPAAGAWTDDEYDFVRATANLTAGLRQTQEKYRRMLKPIKPINVDQGTFDLATWGYAGTDLDGQAFLFSRTASVDQLIVPLVVEGKRQWTNPGATTDAQQGYLEIRNAGTANIDDIFLGEVYDALGCSRYNCPFVPLMFVAAPATRRIHAAGANNDNCYNNTGILSGGGWQWNRGYNHGGGAVRMNYYGIINDNVEDARVDADHLFNRNTFLSTLVHEIGHTAHVGDIKNATYSYYSPTSIMSYSPKNHHGNCWGVFDPDSLFCRLDANYANESAPAFSDTMYTATDTAAADRYTGVLAPRERLAWGYQNRVFGQLVVDPETDYDCTLYQNATDRSHCDSRARLIGRATSDRAIAGHGVTTITSAQTSSGDLNNLLGASAFWFASSDVTFDSSTMWRSKPGAWAQFCINFPTELDSAELGKILVLTGTRSTSSTRTINKASSMLVSTISPSSVPSATRSTSTQGGSFLATITSAAAAHTWCVNLTSSGYTSSIDVRGIRLYLKDGTEFYGPSEALVLESYTQPTTGTNENLVGTTRTITDKSVTGLNPSTMWRAPTNSVSWTSVTVEFPEQVQLGKILVYTGYKATASGITDVARQVQIGRRNENGNWVTFLSHIDSPFSKKTMNIPADHQRAKLWKIQFKSSASGYVVVRGMRFFDVNGQELFEPFVYPSAE